MALKIAIIGCGAIGTGLAQALAQGRVPGARLVALADKVEDKATALARQIAPRPRAVGLRVAAQLADLLVEASGLAAVPEIAGAALAEKKDLMIMSVGALIEDLEWFERFRKKNCRLHFPSGAVAGLDALKAAAAGGGLKKVVLTTRKPPAGLAGAPFFKRRKLEPATLTVATKIFSGSARQAIRLFPANVNVAAAVSLAGLGPDRTKVEIIADPAAVRNSHTLSAEGAFGSFRAITENVPSPTNPKTSWLAVLSALALLQTIVRGELRGT